MSPKYTEQLERTKRYLNRFAAINDGLSHTQSSQNYTDDVYAFFQNCYHLKDWIKNDPYCNTWGEDIEIFINSNNDRQICADLCNGLKHLKLTKSRSNKDPQFSGTNATLNIGGKDAGSTGVKIAISYKIMTTSGEIDAFELARNCVNAWENYIANNTSIS